ncbi:MAG: DUF2784 domain-containing protein [Jatrophihabitantaceae bacterium]
MHTAWGSLAQSVLALHYCYLGYLVSGGYLAWRWPKSIVAHILAAVWAVLIVVTKVPCPLTALQNNLRERADQRPLGASFIDTYVRGTLFPADRIGLAQALVGVVVLTSWAVFAYAVRPPVQRTRRPRH